MGFPDIDFSLPAPDPLEGDALWFVCYRGRVMVSSQPEQPWFPRLPTPRLIGLEDQPRLYAGRMADCHCYAVALEHEEQVPPGFYLEDLRRLLGRLDEITFTMAGRASQLISWYRNHQFCSRCGAAAEAADSDRAMICPACGYTQYPRITPCVIMLVTSGEYALLARAARFPGGMFSCLAGFMEPGETAEQAVEREVYEETGVRVRDLRYHGSQSWPFPHALMLGFTAEHAAGDIRVDGEEIVEAHWWHYRDLPPVPPGGSIARELIDNWVISCGDIR